MFDPASLAILSDRETLLKQSALKQTLIHSLHQLADSYEARWKSLHLPSKHRKVTHGENLQGLPWHLLDFPTQISKESILTMRTLIWWGKSVNSYFLLSGKALATHQQLYERLDPLCDRDYALFLQKDPWTHDFDHPETKVLLSDNSVNPHPFFKIGKSIPFDSKKDIQNQLLEHFEDYLTLLTK